MDENFWAYLIGAGGLGSAVTAMVKELWDWRKGRHREERDAIREEKTELQRRTEEARLLREHAVDVRNFCMRQHGTPSVDLPRWPNCPRDD